MMLKSVILGVAAASTLAAAATPVSDFSMMKAATADVAKAINAPLTLEPLSAARSAGFALVEGDRIFLSDNAVALAHSPQEARALVSLVLAYQDHQFSTRRDKRPNTVDYVVALPLFVIADSMASGRLGYNPHQTDEPVQTPQEIQADRDKRGRKRAALALSLAGKSGSCAGPMVDLLQRMRSDGAGTGATALNNQPSGFARQVLRDLGRTVYPPDRSCS